MAPKDILRMLEGGDRRSIGRANRVAAIVAKDAALFPRLIEGLWSEDSLVRMRAADAAEKVTRQHPEWLRRYKREILGRMAEAEEIEVQWHLAAMITRLPLTRGERKEAAGQLTRYLESRSSIVRTSALQALVEISRGHAEMRPRVREILREALRTGTAAMRARSRKLLAVLETDE